MEMKIRESCLQTGTFIYKPGILVTKQDFHLQSGSLVLQMGFSGYYLPAVNITYNIILDFILKSNSLMQKLKKKFQFLEPSLKDAGHLRSTGDALLLKGLFALCAAPMITVMVSRRREERINIRLDRLYLLCFFF